MKHIHFANDGLIDLRAVTVFGASSKVGANPIGYFGTGLKYAIAVTLRLGCKITLWRGKDKYTFHAEPTRIRVDDFDIVNMTHPDGTVQELAFTTELGKKWEPWQAFRELWCNAIDEGGQVLQGHVTDGDDDRTLVELEGEAMVDVYNHRDNIMLMGAPKWFENGVEIHYKKSHHAYYRNVRVGDSEKPTMLTYNVVGHGMDLTEDRTLKYGFLWNSKIKRALAESGDEQLLKELIDAPEGSLEAALDFSDEDPSPALLKMLEGEDFRAIQNKSLVRMFQKQKGEVIRPKTVKVDTNEEMMLRRALSFLAAIGYDDINSYEINISDDLGEGILGRAYDGEIWLARQTFMKGTKMVAGTLFEEWVHLHHGFHDETRALQDFFLDAMITIGEKLRGEPL